MRRGGGSSTEKWRERQLDSSRSKKKRKPSKWAGLVWVMLFIMVVGLLVQLIALLFETANAVHQEEMVVPERNPAMQANVRGARAESRPQQTVDYQPSGPEPDLEELMKRLRNALAPMQLNYLRSIGEEIPPCEKPDTWKDEQPGFLGGCPASTSCAGFDTLEEAKQKCIEHPDCGGVTANGEKNHFELRGGRNPFPSESQEVSFVRESCYKVASAALVWEAFRSTMSDALEDKSLHLSTTYPTREDDSIYLSISTYRDRTCPHTLRNAFRAAKNPHKLFVGIVQQNCNVQHCYTGTGWGNTRRWVRQDGPDVDCLEEFCLVNPVICERQIRILRLGEREAYGPFFSRYLNSKLYRGENFYLQIDAHTYFRKDWDFWMIEQTKRTPSYPYSVISNYPPSGDPTNTDIWEPPVSYAREHTPSALCGCTFEDAGGDHHTVRLRETSRSFSFGVDPAVPHHSSFIAAGFFFAHGSFVRNVPFDPFMPYLFMGEEISLSIRFWTSGYDIYGPAVNVLKHEYVRKESPKFWESVTMIFNNGGIHNELADLIIPRVQALVGWRDTPAKLNSVLSRLEEYHCGKKRSAQQFTRTMNIQIKSLTQKPPKWCLTGQDQPESTSTISVLS